MDRDTYRKSPQRDSPSKAKVSTQRQSLEYIRSPSNPAIDGQLDLVLSDRRTFPQYVQTRGDSIELSTSMIGNDNPVHAVLDGEGNILGTENCRCASCLNEMS